MGTSRPRPYPTLPEPAQRDTRRKRATMEAFNLAIECELRSRGASLQFSAAADPGSLDCDFRRWELATPAGQLTVRPAGHSVMCRFEDPERAARHGVPWPSMNPHTGKWCHYYFGEDPGAAVRAFTSALDAVLFPRGAR